MNSIRIVIVVLFFCCFLQEAEGQDFPNQPSPPVLVNDYARIFSESERQSLESKLQHYEDSTSSHIAVVTLESTGEYEIGAYAFELAENWGIGQEGKDNGVLILIASGDKKIFIATGYGMEAFIPDALANRIIDEVIRPNFRNQAYYQGVDQATDVMINLLSGNFKAMSSSQGIPIGLVIILIIIFIIIMTIISKRGGGSNRGGGHFGRGTTLGNPYRRGNTWTDFSAGSGSFGGGSFGGGGGFGGFGGGSFGGGGAGGSW